MNLLLVEDDIDLGNGLRAALSRSGMEVTWVRTLGQAVEFAEQYDHDLVVLDLNLPDGTGLDLLRRIRSAHRKTPVLILTAKDALEDRVQGLDLGGDDYLVKPFALAELQSRLRALARRAYANADDTISCGSLVMHPASATVTVQARAVSLSPTEFQILEFLLRRIGRVVPRRTIEEQVLRNTSGDPSAVLDVHMSNLRKKIAPATIRTIRGSGYCIERIEAPMTSDA